jgi:hypothetical protein
MDSDFLLGILLCLKKKTPKLFGEFLSVQLHIQTIFEINTVSSLPQESQ